MALGTDQPVVGQLFQDVGGPAGRAGDGEDRREQVGRNAEGIIDGGGIEIDVGLKVLLLEHDFGDALAHLNPLWLADLRAENLSHALEVRRARVEGLVNPMANAHDFLPLRQRVGDVGIDAVERADFLQHFDDPLVGAAVERPLQGADRAGDGRIHVAQRRDGHAGAEGGGVHAVVGVQHVTHVQRVDFLLRGLFAVDEVEEIGRFAQGRIGREQALALTVAVKIGGDHGDAGDQTKRLEPVFVH